MYFLCSGLAYLSKFTVRAAEEVRGAPRRSISLRSLAHSVMAVLNSKYGPLLPAFSAQQIGNALGWGLVDDTTAFDYGQGAQFATTPLCGGPFGPDSTFCDTVLRPAP